MCAVWLSAKSPADLIADNFDNLETVLSDLAGRRDVRLGKPRAVDGILANTIKKFPAFQTLMRINSTGKVINEVVREGTPGERYRNVGRQGWFTVAGERMESYHGYVKSDDDYLLFWVKPLKSRRSNGSYKSAGALLAKIDIGRVLEKVAPTLSLPFTLIFDKETIFRYNWSPSVKHKSIPLSLKGMEECTILMGTQPVSSGKKLTDAPASKSASKEGASDNAEERAGLNGMQRDTSVSIMTFVPLMVIGGVLILGIFLVLHIKKKVREKHEALIREIEGIEEPAVPKKKEARKKTKQVKKKKKSSGMEEDEFVFALPEETDQSTLQAPPTQRMQTPQPTEQPAPAAPEAQQTGMYTPAAGIQANTSDQRTPPPAPSPDAMHQMRQQVYQELLPQVRRQVEQEFDAMKKDVVTRARIFARTVQTHLDQLSEKMARAENNYNDLQSAVKNSSIKLQEAFDGFEHDPKIQ